MNPDFCGRMWSTGYYFRNQNFTFRLSFYMPLFFVSELPKVSWIAYQPHSDPTISSNFVLIGVCTRWSPPPLETFMFLRIKHTPT